MNVQDSGARRKFATGSQRDIQEGKGRCDLLPPLALLRLSRWFEAGAKKYGEHNWTKGIPQSSFLDSGLRHTFKYLAGMRDEDHLIAAVWNLLCAADQEERVATGELPRSLLNLRWQQAALDKPERPDMVS